MRSYKAQKAALTRAVNSKNHTKVIAEVDRFFKEYDDSNQPTPDDWHRWNIAKQDAEYAIARERGTW